jgi:hypothetical protein
MSETLDRCANADGSDMLDIARTHRAKAGALLQPPMGHAGQQDFQRLEERH